MKGMDRTIIYKKEILAVCISAGWVLGGVKDKYLFRENADEAAQYLHLLLQYVLGQGGLLAESILIWHVGRWTFSYTIYVFQYDS